MHQAASSYSIHVAIIVNVQLEMVHNMWLRAVQELQWLVKERVRLDPPWNLRTWATNGVFSTKGIKKVLMTTTSQRTNSPTSAARTSCIELDE
ncbi:hypothetical protein ACLKA7_011957 [Drosophila subpalustris]